MLAGGNDTDLERDRGWAIGSWLQKNKVKVRNGDLGYLSRTGVLDSDEKAVHRARAARQHGFDGGNGLSRVTRRGASGIGCSAGLHVRRAENQQHGYHPNMPDGARRSPGWRNRDKSHQVRRRDRKVR